MRSRDPKHSEATIFSGKIRCGCCGGWYGSKVWHSNDKYRRVVWQCNHKFKDKTRCRTPHLTEDEIKDAFIRIRPRRIERFIENVKDLPELITEFDESLWAGLVDSLTVHGKDRIAWKLTCGMEIEA